MIRVQDPKQLSSILTRMGFSCEEKERFVVCSSDSPKVLTVSRGTDNVVRMLLDLPKPNGEHESYVFELENIVITISGVVTASIVPFQPTTITVEAKQVILKPSSILIR